MNDVYLTNNNASKRHKRFNGRASDAKSEKSPRQQDKDANTQAIGKNDTGITGAFPKMKTVINHKRKNCGRSHAIITKRRIRTSRLPFFVLAIRLIIMVGRNHHAAF